MFRRKGGKIWITTRCRGLRHSYLFCEEQIFDTVHRKKGLPNLKLHGPHTNYKENVSSVIFLHMRYE